MIELLLVIEEPGLQPVLDAIDIYEGSVPPSATFQVIDVDNTVEVLSVDRIGVSDVN